MKLLNRLMACKATCLKHCLRFRSCPAERWDGKQTACVDGKFCRISQLSSGEGPASCTIQLFGQSCDAKSLTGVSGFA